MILLLFLNALYIWGFYFSCQFDGHEGFDLLPNSQKRLYPRPDNRMIFWKLRYRWRLGDFLAKPVYLCTICMSSVHSIIPYFYYYGIDINSLVKYPFYVLTLAGLNAALMYKIYND